MATNLALHPKLIERAVKLSGEKTKKAAVTRALEEFIARRGRQAPRRRAATQASAQRIAAQRRSLALLERWHRTAVEQGGAPG